MAQSRDHHWSNSERSDKGIPSIILNLETWLTLSAVYSRTPARWQVDDEYLTKFFSQDPNKPFGSNEIDHGQTLILKLDSKYYDKDSVQG